MLNAHGAKPLRPPGTVPHPRRQALLSFSRQNSSRLKLEHGPRYRVFPQGLSPHAGSFPRCPAATRGTDPQATAPLPEPLFQKAFTEQ